MRTESSVKPGRNEKLERLWLLNVLGFYAILLFITIFRHEPWSDEAQAWLLARDSSLKELFAHYMRYEGSPGLWHLLLLIPAKLHFPMFTMQILSGLIACVGVFIFLRYAPFPQWLKTLLPFTFIILYQYAAVARAYVLFPCAFFLAALVFPYRMKRPYLFIGLIIWIASISLHGTVAAIGIILAHYISVLRFWPRLGRQERKQQIVAAGMFILFLLGLVMILWLPKDYNGFGKYANLKLDLSFTKALLMCSDMMMTNMMFAKMNSGLEIILLGGSLLAWYFTIKRLLEKKLLLFFLLPLAGIVLLLLNVGFLNPWHMGIMFILWIFALWIGWAPGEFQQTNGGKMESMKPLMIIVTLVFCMHIYWAYKALSFDWQYSYSGGANVAHYIKTHHMEDRKVYASKPYSAAFLAYFDHNILGNAIDPRRSFILWSYSEAAYRLQAEEVIKGQPDLIIVRTPDIRGNLRVKPFFNYRFEAIYNGGLFWKDRIFHPESFILFRRYGRLHAGKITAAEWEAAIRSLNVDYHRDSLVKNDGPIRGSY